MTNQELDLLVLLYKMQVLSRGCLQRLPTGSRIDRDLHKLKQRNYLLKIDQYYTLSCGAAKIAQAECPEYLYPDTEPTPLPTLEVLYAQFPEDVSGVQVQRAARP